MNNKHLVIFDIDGTLTQTACMDSQAYTAAFADYFGVDELNLNWEECRYSTDSGFAIELFEHYVNRMPRKDEIREIKTKFFALLEARIAKDRSLCQALPGAETLFKRVSALAHWDIAIATGCWRRSAQIKLNYAVLPYQRIPLACGDDHVERHEIIKTAIERAKKQYQQEEYGEIVYVGDRLWDYKASQQLGINFIGVGKEFNQNKLTDMPIIDHYLSDDIIEHLDQCSFSPVFDHVV